MKNSILKLAIPVFMVMSGLLAVRAAGLFTKSGPDEGQFPRAVNLAIRQAADRLLDLAGDSTRTIPPVEQLSPGEYLLRFEHDIHYDSLPFFLAAAFDRFGIHEKYDVAVIDCATNDLILGYSVESFAEGQPACGGRERQAGCHNLSVSFPGLSVKPKANAWGWGAFSALATLVLGFVWFGKTKSKNRPDEWKPAPEMTENTTLLHIGNTVFDPAQMSVSIDGKQDQLTFREAKLLQFLVERPDQVLERGAILAAVWGDEGVIVGRSLDVFVSRLRKILHRDPSLKITSVHGVGYRFETCNSGK